MMINELPKLDFYHSLKLFRKNLRVAQKLLLKTYVKYLFKSVSFMNLNKVKRIFLQTETLCMLQRKTKYF